jgi:glycosyltransferase involved in cell wall biosynthesis
MKYGDRAAATRQRLLQYLPALRAAGIEVDVFPLLGNAHLERVATERGASVPGTAMAYIRRLLQLVRLRRPDVVWVHYELFPYLPGFVEKMAGLAGAPIVYDFDDAIFHMYDQHRSSGVRALLGGKLEPLLSRASACMCGNAYLQDYASRFCRDCRIFPTVVDTDAYRPLPKADGDRPVIGWIGSPSTWPYVRPLLDLIRSVAEQHHAAVRVVGAGPSARNIPGIEAVDWEEATEIAEVQRMDIGIMPVPDEPWARGKSGYKLIQYGACALPVVASPVGVNSEIVRHGDTGFLVSDAEAWRACLTKLLADPALRRRLGQAGRERIDTHYSLAAHAPRLIALLRQVALGEN